jgi:hypothetical protein
MRLPRSHWIRVVLKQGTPAALPAKIRAKKWRAYAFVHIVGYQGVVGEAARGIAVPGVVIFKPGRRISIVVSDSHHLRRFVQPCPNSARSITPFWIHGYVPTTVWRGHEAIRGIHKAIMIQVSDHLLYLR